MTSTGARIARTIASFFPRITGPAKQAYEISRRLREYGYVSPIFTTTPEGTPSHREDNGAVETRRFPVTIPFMGFDLAVSFAKAILKEPIDLIHTHGYRDSLALQSFLAARIRRKPFIVQPHGSLLSYRYLIPQDQWRPYAAYDRLFRRIVLDADKVVVSTNSEGREAEEFGIERSKIAIIPPGVLAIRQRRTHSHGSFRVLFVGRISAGRNVQHLIEAFSQVPAGRDGVLTIVGGEEKLSTREESGYLSHLRMEARSSRNGGRIEFTGPLYGADLEEVYSSSDVFVCASRYESFGQPIVEAAAHGLPVISTPVGVANEIVINGQTGYLVKPNDVTGLANRIQELLDDRKRAGEMGRRMLHTVRNKFDWNHIIRDYVSLYESVST